MEYKVTQKQLERLIEAARKDENGKSHFKLIENKQGEEHFIFRVVCERYHTTKGIIKEVAKGDKSE